MQAFISSVFSKMKVFAFPLKRLWKLFVDYFFCAILFMLLGEIEQWKWLVTISPSHDTIITSVRPKKLWRNWAIHFLVLHLQMHFQLGWAKSRRCNVILWRSHKPDVLGLWALWGWNSVILTVHQDYLLPRQFSREAVLGFQLIHQWEFEVCWRDPTHFARIWETGTLFKLVQDKIWQSCEPDSGFP